MPPWERAISAQIEAVLEDLGLIQTQLDHLPANSFGRANLTDRASELQRKLDMLLAAGEVEGDYDRDDTARHAWGTGPETEAVGLDDVA